MNFGHNSYNNILLTKLIAEVWEEKTKANSLL